MNGADLLRLTGARVLNANSTKKLNISGVTIDSRRFRKSEVFFAIKGERFDGHDFLRDIFRKGISAAVASKRWFAGLKNNEKKFFESKNLVLVKDTIISLGELARNYRRQFLIPVIAIGGSNGKTSTKDFLAHVLSSKYDVLKTEGNKNNAIGVPLTLFRLNKKHEMCVLEVGTNHFGEVKYLCEVAEPQFGLITNIGKEHLEYFKNLRGVLQGEAELMEHIANNYGTFFLNSDDKLLGAKTKNKEIAVFSYGSTSKCDVNGKIIRYKGFYPQVKINYGTKTINTVLNSIGSQSFYSALPAAAVSFFFDVPVSKIKRSLKEFASVTSKRNRLVKAAGFYIIDDTYNSNPDSVKLALENLKKYKASGSKHIVLADMLELGKTSLAEHRNVGKLVKNLGFENLYTFGKLSLKTYSAAKGIKNNFHFEDKDSLTEVLIHVIKRGDIVLVKGSRSMKMEEVVNKLISIN